MDLRTTRIVFAKELRETLRDRRTLLAMVVLPICLYPLIGIGVIQWIGAQEARQAEQPSRVGMLGPGWPALERALGRSKTRFELLRDKSRAELEEGIRDKRIDLVLEIPAEVAELEREGTVKVKLAFDDTRMRSAMAHRRVKEELRDLADRIRKDRLRSRSLPEELFEPVATDVKRIHRGGDKGAHIMAEVVPLLVILMVLLGAFYPAIDVTAGEKERGTLETLLAAPVARTSLIAGKYLVVALVAAFTGLLNLASIGLTLALGVGPAVRSAGVEVAIPWGAVALTVVAMVPAALFFAGTMLAVAALGRSFKEAQNLLSPVMVVFTLPAVAARLPGVELTPFTALLPVVNISLLIHDLIIGRVQWLPALVTVASLVGYTAVALRLASRVFESEHLLFAPDPSLGKVSLWKRLTGRARAAAPAPTSSQAATLFLVVMALILLVGRPLQSGSLIGGLLVTEWALIGLPVLLLLRIGRLEARSTLALARPTGSALLGALLAGVSAWYLVGVLVETVQQQVLPMPPDLIKAYHRALFSTERFLALDLFVLALSPAICEEALFRGVLLQATRRTMSASSAVIVNGLLFGLFHLSPYRFFSTMILGMVLALLVLRTGSIWPGILFHFLNNASAIVAGRLLGDQADGATPPALSWPLLATTLVIFVAGMALALRPRAAGSRAASSDPPGR